MKTKTSTGGAKIAPVADTATPIAGTHAVAEEKTVETDS